GCSTGKPDADLNSNCAAGAGLRTTIPPPSRACRPKNLRALQSTCVPTSTSVRPRSLKAPCGRTEDLRPILVRTQSIAERYPIDLVEEQALAPEFVDERDAV